MGEEVDLGKFEQEQSSKRKAATGRVSSILEIQAEVVSLLRQGHSHKEISDSLRRIGYTHIEIESILSDADDMLAPQRGKKSPMDYMFYAIIALLLLAIGSAVFLQLFSDSKDCGEDLLCVEKIRNCTPGEFSSTFAGIAVNYLISREVGMCRVQAEVASAPPGASERQGMSMVCLHPIKEGKVDLSSQYGECEGSLADQWRA